MLPANACDNEVVDPAGVGWLGRDPTTDEQEVVEWISSRPLPSRILHVGIGNAYLTGKFGKRVIQGLTKDGGEARHATTLGLNAILCNKYDVHSYQSLLNQPFDCIVDVNIRSYACCDVHFVEYMSLLRATLSRHGALLTNRRGLEYLRPTSIGALKELCPEWSIRQEGNVVILRRRPARLKTRVIDFLKSIGTTSSHE
jgi:hypothetical protein